MLRVPTLPLRRRIPWKVRSAIGRGGAGRGCGNSWRRLTGRKPRLWTWTWSPGAMAAVAYPMTWPYLRTVSPAAIARSATLWPDGTSKTVTTLMAPTVSGVAAGVSDPTTATSSLGWRWMGVRRLRAVFIGLCRLAPMGAAVKAGAVWTSDV